VLGNVYNQQASQSGDTARREQLFNKAIGAYQAAIKINPNNDAAHTNLGTVYYQMGNFDGARQAAEAALRIKPGDASTHYLLGTILLQSDPTKDPSLLDKAKEQFELAIKNESGLGAAYIGLANVYLFKKDYVNALAQAQKGVDLMKPDPDPFALWALAQAQCAGGNKAAGTQTLQQILSKNVPDAVFVQQVQATMAQCK
jgi:tetratricopeptide (TPR) repeat protein